MKKKSIALHVLSGVLVLSLLAGCGVTSTPPAGSGGSSGAANSGGSASAPTVSSTNTLPENAEIVIKFGHNDSELGLLESPWYAYSRVFKNVVETKSGGRIGVQVFPNNQLGDLPSMLEQTVSGTIQMTGGQNTGLLATYLPKIQVLDIPYVFTDLNTSLTILNGEFGQQLSQDVIDAAGVRILSYLPTAFRNFASNTKPIQTADDIKGMKVRVMEIPLHMDMIESMGGIPSVISFAELYSALQTGVVDAQEQAPYTMVMNNLQEVTKYYSLTQHLLNSNCVTMNEKFFQSLSPEDQQIILSAARDAQRAMMGITTANEPEVFDKLRSAGVEIYAPSAEELETFRAATRDNAVEYLASIGVDEDYVRDFLELVDSTQAEIDAMS
ncbi:MAG: TRAP transporter substrate-binding protein [Lawsonibacter sp.]|jgi:tripartite ATP-independent transporter DctP family solute receptor